MPGSPLRIACARPAPKSRFVVSGLAWEKIDGNRNRNRSGNGDGKGNGKGKGKGNGEAG
jgi:hypothetical protein